jgi:hypothetical protein
MKTFQSIQTSFHVVDAHHLPSAATLLPRLIELPRQRSETFVISVATMTSIRYDLDWVQSLTSVIALHGIFSSARSVYSHQSLIVASCETHQPNVFVA